jgi:hypothetical protein
MVVEYFKLDLLKVLNQGGAELLKADSRRFSLEPGVVKYNKDSKPLHDLILGAKP